VYKSVDYAYVYLRLHALAPVYINPRVRVVSSTTTYVAFS
jgi:hypothetical protein